MHQLNICSQIHVFYQVVYCHRNIVQYLNHFEETFHLLNHTKILVLNYQGCYLQLHQWSILFAQPIFQHMYLVILHLSIYVLCQSLPVSIRLVQYIQWIHAQFQLLIEIYLLKTIT